MGAVCAAGVRHPCLPKQLWPAGQEPVEALCAMGVLVKAAAACGDRPCGRIAGRRRDSVVLAEASLGHASVRIPPGKPALAQAIIRKQISSTNLSQSDSERLRYNLICCWVMFWHAPFESGAALQRYKCSYHQRALQLSTQCRSQLLHVMPCEALYRLGYTRCCGRSS